MRVLRYVMHGRVTEWTTYRTRYFIFLGFWNIDKFSHSHYFVDTNFGLLMQLLPLIVSVLPTELRLAVFRPFKELKRSLPHLKHLLRCVAIQFALIWFQFVGHGFFDYSTILSLDLREFLEHIIQTVLDVGFVLVGAFNPLILELDERLAVPLNVALL